MPTAAEVNEVILDAEQRFGLLDLQVGGFELYAALRVSLQREYLKLFGEKIGNIGHNRSRVKTHIRDLWTAGALERAKRWRWPQEPAPLLVLAHPRWVGHRGHRICPYTQPLLEGVSARRWTLVEPDQGSRYPAQADDVLWTEKGLLQVTSHLALRPSVEFLRRGAAELRGAVDLLDQQLGIRIPARQLIRHAIRQLLKFAFFRPLIERMLDHAQPRVVLEVVSYGELAAVLNHVCTERGIDVMELQHGVLGPGHLAYRARAQPRKCWPTKFLSWGDAWTDATPDFFLPDQSRCSIGYAWLERAIAETSRKQSATPTLLVLSQWTIGKELSDFVAGAAEEIASQGWRIRYRLHPSERGAWRTRYPGLKHEAIDVIDGQTSVYEDLAGADAQLGVYSTSVLEGVAFGLPTFLAPAPGREGLEWLVREGVATPVNHKGELIDGLRTFHRKPVSHNEEFVGRLWKKGAKENMANLLSGTLSRSP